LLLGLELPLQQMLPKNYQAALDLVAQAISRVTGASMTSVVKAALRERYARIEGWTRKASVEELLAIADRAAAHVKSPNVDHAQLLYDENGLPK
jgi:antitoxin VapB